MQTGTLGFKATFGGGAKSLLSNGSYEYARSMEFVNGDHGQEGVDKMQSKSYLIDDEALKNKSIGSYRDRVVGIDHEMNTHVEMDFEKLTNFQDMLNYQSNDPISSKGGATYMRQKGSKLRSAEMSRHPTQNEVESNNSIQNEDTDVIENIHIMRNTNNYDTSPNFKQLLQ